MTENELMNWTMSICLCALAIALSLRWIIGIVRDIRSDDE